MCISVFLKRPASAQNFDSRQSTATARSGFTLTELLVVIAIIGVLAAIIIPTVARVRVSAQRAGSLSNLKGIAAGVILYANDHKGQLPYWNGNSSTGGFTGDSGNEWTVALGPYLPTPERRWSFLNEAPGSRAVSPAIVDPLIPDGYHHPTGDFGGNGKLFARAYNGEPKVRMAQLLRPSQTILAISVKNGSGQGAWGLNHGYITDFNNTTTPLPNDWAETGHYLCAFADGHSSAMAIRDFDTKAKRTALFGP